MQSKRKILTTFTLLFTLLLSSSLSGIAQKGEEGKKGKEQTGKEEPSKMRSKKAREPAIEVSEAEMKKIVSLHQKIRPIQMEAQKKMMKNLKDSELKRQRFTEIRRAQKSGQNPDMTKKEKKAMKALEKENKKARKEMKGKIRKKVKAKGMKWKRFRKVSRAVQKYPKLRKRYRKRMKKATGGRKKMQDPKKSEGSKK